MQIEHFSYFSFMKKDIEFAVSVQDSSGNKVWDNNSRQNYVIDFRQVSFI